MHWWSIESALSAVLPLEPSNHLLMVDQLSPVGLLDALLHSFEKEPVFFRHTQSRLLHQFRHVLAAVTGNLRKPRNLFRSEIDFHARKCRDSVEFCQHSASSQTRRCAWRAGMEGAFRKYTDRVPSCARVC